MPGSGSRSTALIRVKIVASAPIPRASAITTISAKPGLVSSIRRPYRGSSQKIRKSRFVQLLTHKTSLLIFQRWLRLCAHWGRTIPRLVSPGYVRFLDQLATQAMPAANVTAAGESGRQGRGKHHYPVTNSRSRRAASFQGLHLLPAPVL